MIQQLKQQIKDIEERIKLIQKECNHPIAARTTENRGYSGHWDDPEGSYWTEHTCLLCEAKWMTDQDWKSTGDGLGRPKN
jgi:hypothetical protein